MPHYRATIRYGAQRKQYWMHDVEADDAAAALNAVAAALPPEVVAVTDIVELRVQSDPEKREYTPEA